MMMRNFITCFSAIMVILMFLQHHLVASLSPIEQKTALFQFKQSLTISTPTKCYYDPYDSYSDSYIDSYSNFYIDSYSNFYIGSYPDSNVDSYTDPYIDFYVSFSHPKTMNWSMSSDYCTWEGVTCQHNTGHVIGLDLSCSQLEGAILPNSTLFQLSHLRFLNLSGNHLFLDPSRISCMYKLVSLDFSGQSLFQNLTQLRVPNLNWVDISSVLLVNLSTSLRILNLRNTDLYGVLSQEVFHLPNLEVLDLSSVHINSVLLMNLSTSLRILNLRNTGLYGVLPQEVFHLPNLEVLDLSNNFELAVILPKVKWGSSGTLQHLFLEGTNFHSGRIPDSIGFLVSLVTLKLSYSNLCGPIPKSIGNLDELTYLGLQKNNLNGPILTFLANLTNLRYLHLSYNNFIGPFPSSLVAHSRDLVEINLSHNNFTGPLPGLFDLPSLKLIELSNNGFMGQLHEFDSSNMQFFSCRNNSLSGSIPQSFSQLVYLTRLDFSSNNFSGVFDLKMFSRLESLRYLDLSHNSVSVRNTSMVTLPPKLSILGLSSCNMKEFPQFSRDAGISLEYVDLSNNEIDGEIPHWIGSVGSYLNLSQNMLIGGLEQLPWNSIQYLDIHSNMLNGSLPTLICNSSSLKILNLSNNSLSGVLPICRTHLTSLLVFDLRMNNIQGKIPATLSNFHNLETIDLNGNRLEGRIPSSFAQFDSLQVLDLGNNQIKDTFPQFLEALLYLQILVLKSNKFYGLIKNSSKIDYPFYSLRIIDLSYNEFSGPLPSIYFRNFKAMMNGFVNEMERSYMESSDSTDLVIKGVDIVLKRILTVFTTIDVSKNHFEGKIPVELGCLVSLRFLNLSHNHFTGQMPPSIGKMTVLESLDLSYNQLEGEIPQQFTDLFSLALLNLSCNELRGHIPEGFQFNTFENDSYVGNLGLCGNPLSKKCGHDNVMQEEGEDEDNGYLFSGFTWKAVVIGYGFGVVPAFIIGNLMLQAGKPKWFAGIIARELGLKVRRMEIRMG